jgi:trypsin inhibitor
MVAVALSLLGLACGGGQLRNDGGWQPAAACALPFETGPCEALIPVYAYVGGACVPRTYGGCEGNDNRFTTLEECLMTCEGRPVPNSCPAGRTAQQICLACGPAGGCAKSETVCAIACDADAGVPCASPLPFCSEGVCQLAGCF